MEQKTTETTGPRQPRPVYYEPDHHDAADEIAAVLAQRGYKPTSDWGLMDGSYPAVARLGSGELRAYNGTDTVAVPELEEYASPEAYAAAIADFLDGKTDGVYPAPDMSAEREAVEHYLRHLLAAAERAELAVGSRYGKVRDPKKSLRMAVAAMVDEAQRLQKHLGEIEVAQLRSVAEFAEDLRTTWTVHLTNGFLTGYPSWGRAAFVARSFNRPMVVRISGPEGTVPLVGESLTRAIEGGER